MRKTFLLALALMLTLSAVAKAELKTCAANRSYCEAEAKKKGWKQPQCAEAFTVCMGSGEWHTSGPFGAHRPKC